MEQAFYAKIETINITSYETNTLRVTAENKEGLTLRLDENAEVKVGAVYEFTCKPIIFKEKEQLEVTVFTHIDETDITFERRQELMSAFYLYSPVDSTVSKKIIEDGCEYLFFILSSCLKSSSKICLLYQRYCRVYL